MKRHVVIGILLPVVLLLVASILIQLSPRPLRNSYPPSSITIEREETVRDRMTIAVAIEILVMSLILQPWRFPWTLTRFVIGEAVLFVWSGLMGAIAMHGGALLALHALVLMAISLFFLPGMILVLIGRKILELIAKKGSGNGERRLV